MPTYAGFGPEAILSLDGSPLTSVEVSVYEDGTNTLATLYSSSVGGAQANPVSTDSYGNLVFWLEGGDYELEYNSHRVAFSTYVTDNVEHAAQHNAGEADPISGLSPSQITGTAAILGANTFTGNQTLSNVNVVLGTTTGTKIGTATSQKLGFFNATPVVQQTGNALDALEALGLLASPTLAAADITGLGTMATAASADYAALASANTFTAAQTIRNATYAKILLDGGSTSGNGPLIEFTSAGNSGELYGYMGRDGAINGGTGTDLLLYSVYGLKVQRGSTTLAHFGSASNTFTAFSASAVPVIAKGAAAQDADFLTVQNSAGTKLGGWDKYGQLNTQYLTDVTGASPYLRLQSTSLIAINQGNAANVAFAVRGMAAQTGALTLWQDSASATLASVSAAGKGFFADVATSSSGAGSLFTQYVQYGASTGPYIQLTSTGGTVAVRSRATNEIPLTVNGVTSQSALLQSWQVNAAEVASISAAGKGLFTSIGPVSASTFNILDNTGGAVATARTTDFLVNYRLIAGSTTGVESFRTFGNSLLGVSNAAHIPVQVRGAASQSANLQNWESSAGTVLSAIDSAGAFVGGSSVSVKLWNRTVQGTGGGSLYIGGSATGAATDGVVIDGNATTFSTGVTSGEWSSLRVGQNNNPSASSTAIHNAILVNPTINYASGGAGSYNALRIKVTETALPSGDNYLIRASAGAAGTTEKFSVKNDGVVFIANSSAPATPTGGGAIFVEGGALKFIGSSGTITTIAEA